MGAREQEASLPRPCRPHPRRIRQNRAGERAGTTRAAVWRCTAKECRRRAHAALYLLSPFILCASAMKACRLEAKDLTVLTHKVYFCSEIDGNPAVLPTSKTKMSSHLKDLIELFLYTSYISTSAVYTHQVT
ncbi:unnamed protein product [Urochloa humidicola]